MMSKKQWFVLLCIFVVYLLLGAALFHNIESKQEAIRMQIEREERKEIQELLKSHISNNIQDEIFQKFSDYCGKPLSINMENYEDQKKWDFYHSLFFVITVVSTIGYGNLAPTTMFGRIFMIFYGLIGIPMNGIVMVTLGGFFGRSFTKLYHRWKTSKMQYDAARLGLISQIILYLVPGFTFFIFLPSVIMMIFEDWPYDVAVYYAFVTLTTIGFGDYVAGTGDGRNFGEFYFTIYKIFLLVWVIGGLGYVVMVLGFITQAMRSKKMQKFEHLISHNIKKTPNKIRQELRLLLNEYLFLRVKRVYKGDFEYVPTKIERSQSCPQLTTYESKNSPSMRKRAFSECPQSFTLHRIKSDSDLEKIDKELTFKQRDLFLEQKNLLLKVADALGNFESEKPPEDSMCYGGFSDDEILATEKYGSQWSLNTQSRSIKIPKRRRALSEVKVSTICTENDNNCFLYKRDSDKYLKHFRSRNRTFSEPNTRVKHSQGIFQKIKNKFINPKDERNIDLEKQNFYSTKDKKRNSIFHNLEKQYINNRNGGCSSELPTEQDAVLEQTSIADFIRALSVVTTSENIYNTPNPQRKFGTAGPPPPNKQSPPRTRRFAIRPNLHTRRISLANTAPNIEKTIRRFSLRPVEENLLAPPAYNAHPAEFIGSNPRFPKAINIPQIPFANSIQRQMGLKNDKTGIFYNIS